MRARPFLSAALAGAMVATSLPAVAETPLPPAPPSAPPAPPSAPGASPSRGYPPGSYPQAPPPTGAYPPGAYPPGAYPPGAYPPGAYPPGAYPPGAYPQGAYPQGAYPPPYYYAPPGAMPPPGYWQGYEPPAMERRSTGAMIGGIVMVSLGGVGLVTGTLMALNGSLDCSQFECTRNNTPGIALTIISALVLSAGIPTLLYGAKRVRVKAGEPEATLPSRLGAPWVAGSDPRRGPVTGGWSWQF